MKNIIKTIFVTLLMIGISACSDDYFDVNTPSGAAQEDQLRMKDLMAPIIYRTVMGQQSAEEVFGNYNQYFTGWGGLATGETTASGLWTNFYLYSLPNIMTIKEKAATLGATQYMAVADILTAINLGIVTDTWDNVPYSEAASGITNTSPKFDSQQQIYTSLLGLLDNAITILETPNASIYELSNDDLIYKGNMDKWLRAAYTLKARYQLHLVSAGMVSPNEVLTTIEKGFMGNDDDFQMPFSTRNINPWYAQEVVAKSKGNFHNDLASQLVSSMNGDYYPFQSAALTIDPRLPLFGSIPAGSTEWKGYISGGAGKSPDGTAANVSFLADGYYTSVDSPIPIITYGEALFIKAEAAFLANGGSTTSVGSNAIAYNAYLDGIAASMDKFGANGSDYLADPAIAVGESGLMLHHIMKEKYIHNFLNPETFVDYRRYDFSDQVFIGLKMREEADSSGEYAGEWFRRASYPSTEVTRNRTAVEANKQTPVTPVWWDAQN